jgi:hypothetical protein
MAAKAKKIGKIAAAAGWQVACTDPGRQPSGAQRMREQEMWQIVRSILGTPVRRAVLSASVGIGLALGGAACDHRLPVQSADQGTSGDGAAELLDGGAIARYAAPQPDAVAPNGPDRGVSPSPSVYAAPFPDEPLPDGGTAGKYGAPFFDAG